MVKPEPDERSAERRALDEQIASEPHRPIPKLPKGSKGIPIEEFLRRRDRRWPVAVKGVVENGVVRPLDPDVKLPEQAHVIIVAADAE